MTREDIVKMIRDEHYGSSNYVEAFEKAAAEAAARKFLEGLEDKGGKI